MMKQVTHRLVKQVNSHKTPWEALCFYRGGHRRRHLGDKLRTISPPSLQFYSAIWRKCNLEFEQFQFQPQYQRRMWWKKSFVSVAGIRKKKTNINLCHFLPKNDYVFWKHLYYLWSCVKFESLSALLTKTKNVGVKTAFFLFFLHTYFVLFKQNWSPSQPRKAWEWPGRALCNQLWTHTHTHCHAHPHTHTHALPTMSENTQLWECLCFKCVWPGQPALHVSRPASRLFISCPDKTRHYLFFFLT